MRYARSVLPLILTGALFLVPAYPASQTAGPAPKDTASPAPKKEPVKNFTPPANSQADQRLAKKQSQMKQRDKEMDQRMQKRNKK